MSDWLLAAHHENLTIALSVVAVVISSFSLGWNFYRDVILKPRFRVRLRIAERPISAMNPEEKPRPWWCLNSKRVWVPYLELSVVNFGPGLMVVRAAVIKTGSSVERVLAENLGAHLEKGQRVNIGIPNHNECILDKKPRRIGILDSFGRIRWAPGKDLKKVQREYVEERARRAREDGRRL